MEINIDIKTLRLRLGWTHSDLARRLSCEVETVRSWEEGESVPGREILSHLEYLSLQADLAATQVATLPIVDSCLKSYDLDQISSEQLQKITPDVDIQVK